MNNNLQAMVEEILKQDETFADQVCEAKDAKEIQTVFAAKDITLTEEEAEAMLAQLQKLKENGADELAEEDLENVAGGWFVIPFMIAVTTLAIYTYYLRRRKK